MKGQIPKFLPTSLAFKGEKRQERDCAYSNVMKSNHLSQIKRLSKRVLYRLTVKQWNRLGVQGKAVSPHD